MNLQSIPDIVWSKLTKEAIVRRGQQGGVRPWVRSLFYEHIYSKWSEGKVDYSLNLADETDAGWDDLVVQWQAISGESPSMGAALKDQSVGKAFVQGFDDHTSARLWEKYNQKSRGDRFQFVVNSGGGMVLFNRMRRACQVYIKEKCAGDPGRSCVKGWKVFGEEKGMGRSDSCCVYTAVKYTDAGLTTLVENYIWPQVKDLVDTDFKPLGFYSVCNKPLWAMPMPDPNREKLVLGRESKGSAGGLMGNILAKAYTEAIEKRYFFESGLTKLAQAEAKEIVEQLYA